MLSQKTLVDIVKDEIENKIRHGEILGSYYYILLNGKMYPRDDYDVEVEEGVFSANDIYALVDIRTPFSFDNFLFHIDYLQTSSVEDIVDDYLRKMGFTIEHFGVFPPAPPTPNLKYFIRARVELNNDTPEYLVIDIYDIDALARTLHIPQIVEQELGIKPRKITEDDAFDIKSIVAWKQPILAGYTYDDAWNILRDYYVNHNNLIKDKANKIFLSYMNLFPTPYEVCYEWEAGRLVKTDCLKLVLRSS